MQAREVGAGAPPELMGPALALADQEDPAAAPPAPDQQRHLPAGECGRGRGARQPQPRANAAPSWRQRNCHASRQRGVTGFDPPPLACAQVNKATLGLLKFVEPYIAFGTPNLKTVKSLIYKRGFGKVRSARGAELAGAERAHCTM